MKKIGIIDYFIDEWHSNEYLKLFKKASEELKLDYEIAYAYAEVEMEGRLSTNEWCAKNGIVRCENIDELCAKSDNILILAPANPETHLRYAKAALQYGKSTYIDKTFAPDLKTAKEIFDIAEKNNVKIFSTSALRYAKELDGLENAKSVIFTGGGRSLEEYIIHQIEMAVRLMGKAATDIRVFNMEKQATVVIDFSGKLATLNYSYSDCNFSVDAQLDARQRCTYRCIEDDGYFYTLAKTILTFFETEKLPFLKEETLYVIAIRDAIMEGINAEIGEKIKIK